MQFLMRLIHISLQNSQKYHIWGILSKPEHT